MSPWNRERFVRSLTGSLSRICTKMKCHVAPEIGRAVSPGILPPLWQCVRSRPGPGLDPAAGLCIATVGDEGHPGGAKRESLSMDTVR